MITLLNYANQAFRTSQRKNCLTGLSVGGVDQVISRNPKDIDNTFYQKNKLILDEPRGNGLWLWKPYFILRELRALPEGEWLFYCDSGAYFIHSIHPLLDIAVKSDCYLMTFADNNLERHYTKKDALLLLDADEPHITDTPQRLGGFSLWKKCQQSIDFATEWLEYAQDHRVISDAENKLGEPNYSDFRDHRHDQSIFSILAKKHGLPGYRDPSQWGNNYTAKYPNSPYPQLIELTRKRDVPITKRVTQKVKRLFSLVGISKQHP